MISLPLIPLTINSIRAGLLHLNKENTRLLSKTLNEQKDTMLLHMNLNSYQFVLQCLSKTPVTICNIQKNGIKLALSLKCYQTNNTTFVWMVPALLLYKAVDLFGHILKSVILQLFHQLYLIRFPLITTMITLSHKQSPALSMNISQPMFQKHTTMQYPYH